MAEEADQECLSYVVNPDEFSASLSDAKVVGLFGRKVTKPFPLKNVSGSTDGPLRLGLQTDVYVLPASNRICVTYES